MEHQCCNKKDPIFWTTIEDSDDIIMIPHDENCSFCVTQHSMEESVKHFTSARLEFSFYMEDGKKHDISLTHDQLR